MSNLDRNVRTCVYDKALAQFGLEIQLIVAIEELSELAKELCKLRRDPENFDFFALAEEVADVQIMLEQLEHFFCLTSDIDTWRDEKINRLMNRVMRAQAEQARKEKEYGTSQNESDPVESN